MVEYTEREAEEAGWVEFVKNREEFRELESSRKRGAKADADRLVSRNRPFRGTLPKSESRNARYRLRLAENFLERGRWQTNSRTLFVSKQTSWFSAAGIRNASRSKITESFSENAISILIKVEYLILLYFISQESELIKDLNNLASTIKSVDLCG